MCLSTIAANSSQPKQHAVSGCIRPILWSLLPSLCFGSSDVACVDSRQAVHRHCSVYTPHVSPPTRQSDADICSRNRHREQWMYCLQRSPQAQLASDISNILTQFVCYMMTRLRCCGYCYPRKGVLAAFGSCQQRIGNLIDSEIVKSNNRVSIAILF